MVNTMFLSFPGSYPGNQSDLVLGNYDKFITTIKLHLSGRQNYGHLNLPGSYCTKRNYCFALLQRHTFNNATIARVLSAVWYASKNVIKTVRSVCVARRQHFPKNCVKRSVPFRSTVLSNLFHGPLRSLARFVPF